MLGWWKSRALRRSTGQQLYEGIVAQARHPELYAVWSVPDSMDGRLEMLLLHTVLVLDRLHAEGPITQRPGQRLMERLVADVDDALRQIGLGDDSVSPRIERLGRAIAERARDYRAALDLEADASSDDTGAPSTLASKLVEHAYRLDPAAIEPDLRAKAGGLADYARRSRVTLANISANDILSGRLAFPAVATDRHPRAEEGPR